MPKNTDNNGEAKVNLDNLRRTLSRSNSTHWPCADLERTTTLSCHNGWALTRKSSHNRKNIVAHIVTNTWSEVISDFETGYFDGVFSGAIIVMFFI